MCLALARALVEILSAFGAEALAILPTEQPERKVKQELFCAKGKQINLFSLTKGDSILIFRFFLLVRKDGGIKGKIQILRNRCKTPGAGT